MTGNFTDTIASSIKRSQKLVLIVSAGYSGVEDHWMSVYLYSRERRRSFGISELDFHIYSEQKVDLLRQLLEYGNSTSW